MRKTLLLFFIMLMVSAARVCAADTIDSLLVTPSLDEQRFRSGTLDIKFVTPRHTTVAYHLLDADGKTVAQGTLPSEGKAGRRHITLTVDSVNRWTADSPYLYTLSLTPVHDKGGKSIGKATGKGQSHTTDHATAVTRRVGFRLVAVRYARLYLNGCPLLIKGVCLHGMKAGQSRNELAATVRLLKQHNVNAVFTDLCDPVWYDLCDEYGLYVCADLSATGASGAATASALYDHPSLVMWNVGHDGCDRTAATALRAAVKAMDSQRPVLWAGTDADSQLTDIYLPIDPTPKQAADYGATRRKGTEKPMLMASFMSAVGNGYGSMAEYMSLPDSFTKLAGGFLCDGTLALMQAAAPAMEEVRYQYRDITLYSHAPRVGRLELFNNSYYAPQDGMVIDWAVRHNGAVVRHGVYDKALSIPPRRSRMIKLGYGDLFKAYPEGELTLDVVCRQKGTAATASANATAGQVLATGQIDVRTLREKRSLAQAIEAVSASSASSAATSATPSSKRGYGQLKLKRGASIDISNSRFHIAFDKATGWLSSYTAGGRSLLADGGTLRPCFWRQLTDNDRAADVEKRFGQMADPQLSLTSLSAVKSKADSTGCRHITVDAVYDITGTDLTLAMRYTIDESGAMKVEQTVTPAHASDASNAAEAAAGGKPSVPTALRYGMAMTIPSAMDSVTYFGRGPLENYADRKSSQAVGIYTTSAGSMGYAYTPRQESGNRCDMRWMRLADSRGCGLEVLSPYTFDGGVELSSTGSGSMVLHIDGSQAGIGRYVNTTDYADTLNSYRVVLNKRTLVFWLRPIGGADRD